VAEWFKAPVLKTGRGFTLPRGFESHPFRHLVAIITTTSKLAVYVRKAGGSRGKVCAHPEQENQTHIALLCRVSNVRAQRVLWLKTSILLLPAGFEAGATMAAHRKTTWLRRGSESKETQASRQSLSSSTTMSYRTQSRSNRGTQLNTAGMNREEIRVWDKRSERLTRKRPDPAHVASEACTSRKILMR
jgi:hypothetical protein